MLIGCSLVCVRLKVKVLIRDLKLCFQIVSICVLRPQDRKKFVILYCREFVVAFLHPRKPREDFHLLQILNYDSIIYLKRNMCTLKMVIFPICKHFKITFE